MLTPLAVGSTGNVLGVSATIIYAQTISFGILATIGATGVILDVEAGLHAMNVRRDAHGGINYLYLPLGYSLTNIKLVKYIGTVF